MAIPGHVCPNSSLKILHKRGACVPIPAQIRTKCVPTCGGDRMGSFAGWSGENSLDFEHESRMYGGEEEEEDEVEQRREKERAMLGKGSRQGRRRKGGRA